MRGWPSLVRSPHCPAPRGSPAPGRSGLRPLRGRRPSMSSQCSGGVPWMTLVKLTISLAAVSATIPASAAIRPAGAGSPPRRRRAWPRGRWLRRRPAWPAPPGPRAPARAPRPAGPGPRGRRPAPARDDQQAARQGQRTLMARPGRKSNRLSRLAPPAIRPAFTATSSGPPRQQRARGQPGRADAAELDRAGGHLALGQGAQVTAEARAGRRCPRGRRNRRRRRAPPAAVTSAARSRPARPGREQRPRPWPRRRRGPLQQGDRLAPVIGPRPGRRPARRARPEQRVRAA